MSDSDTVSERAAIISMVAGVCVSIFIQYKIYSMHSSHHAESSAMDAPRSFVLNAHLDTLTTAGKKAYAQAGPEEVYNRPRLFHKLIRFYLKNEINISFYHFHSSAPLWPVYRHSSTSEKVIRPQVTRKGVRAAMFPSLHATCIKE